MCFSAQKNFMYKKAFLSQTLKNGSNMIGMASAISRISPRWGYSFSPNKHY